MLQDKIAAVKRLQRLLNSEPSNINRLKCLYYNNLFINVVINQYTGYIENPSTVSDHFYISVIGTNREDVINKLCKCLQESKFSHIISSDYKTLVNQISVDYTATPKKQRLQNINWVINYNQEKSNKLN